MACLSDSVVATFVQGQATADEIATVEAHVAECADCRGLIANMAGIAPVAGEGSRTLLDNAGADEAETRAPSRPLSRPDLPSRIYRARWMVAIVLVGVGLASGIVAGARGQARARAITSALAEARAAVADGDAARARVAATAAGARAEAAGMTAAASDARRLASAAWLLAHDGARAVTAARAAEALARRAGDAPRAIDAALALALAQSQLSDFGAARETLLDVLARADALHDDARRKLAARDLAALALHAGKLDEAARWTSRY